MGGEAGGEDRARARAGVVTSMHTDTHARAPIPYPAGLKQTLGFRVEGLGFGS